MMKLHDILRQPPCKTVICERCDGSGIINRRGMVTSDDCPQCRTGTYPQYNSGTTLVTDYEAWVAEVRQAVAAEAAGGDDG